MIWEKESKYALAGYMTGPTRCTMSTHTQNTSLGKKNATRRDILFQKTASRKRTPGHPAKNKDPCQILSQTKKCCQLHAARAVHMHVDFSLSGELVGPT
jgi:hypothetical protein